MRNPGVAEPSALCTALPNNMFLRYDVIDSKELLLYSARKYVGFTRPAIRYKGHVRLHLTGPSLVAERNAVAVKLRSGSFRS